MKCRFCDTLLEDVFIDLVNSPPSNSFLKQEQLNEPEIFYPLKLYVCRNCFLTQIDEYKKTKEIFSDEYLYFSSFSKSWLEHSRQYTQMMIERFCYNDKSFVIEIASNDGYLLQYFKEKNIPVLGIEPTKSTAKVAIEKGIDTITEFFGVSFAQRFLNERGKADLIIGNNVLAHVPDINDFVEGLKIPLKEEGVITMEFPHLLQLIENSQFDTIYHEHFSYLSFMTVQKVFKAHGLDIFDVQELKTHGGSLRIFVKHEEDGSKRILDSVPDLIRLEKNKGLDNISAYNDFQQKANKIKDDLLEFLITQKKEKKTVAGYGAAAKGNTLINYCGIKQDLIAFVVDKSPFKQNHFLPASHIPVVNESHISETKPDFILILPWNIKDEIIYQLDYIKEWGGRFIVPIPQLIIQ